MDQLFLEVEDEVPDFDMGEFVPENGNFVNDPGLMQDLGLFGRFLDSDGFES